MNLVWLIPALPLLGFLIIGLFPKLLNKSLTGIIGAGSVLASFLVVLTVLFPFLSGSAQPQTIPLFDWIVTGTVKIEFSFLIDRLSVLMMSIITGIGFLIHLYSIGYMHDDEGFKRYFAYLNLFVFSMLILVMGSNYLVMFAGWEGVGLCSYLLIGFWFKKTEYNNAARKAFVMNRIGDLGFLLGMLLLFLQFRTLDFATIFAEAPVVFTAGSGIVVAITLLLFIGATGKSAQIPLYTWLPDAMAGPTPVSALIHAATMVTAGIYMIVRSNVLYSLAPYTLDIIQYIGLATALLAATIALVQNDIKKVLAYSTVSQLGFMFFALGLGAYTAAMFHLMTHAFFKALMFLGSGSVIHAMSGEQDIRSMGGLKKKMPVTYITFLIGTLAISGIPPFAGFFSKDMILASAFAKSPLLFGIGLAGALMTAFYMFRLLFLTFHGEFRGTEHQKHHLHESPLIMTLPLMVLAALSVVGGWVGIPEALHGSNGFHHYFDTIISQGAPHLPHLEHSTEYLLMGISTAAVVLVILIAFVVYVSKKSVPSSQESTYSVPHKLLYRKYYIDELYQSLIGKPLYWFSDVFYSVFEIRVIDTIVNSWGKGVKQSSAGLKYIQNGSISFYLFAMVIGIILVLTFSKYAQIFTSLF
jgi:NADH-quinone oxidoreductase subunit L